jgi:hypothetical protein
MVLGEPAEVEAATRQRMYQLAPTASLMQPIPPTQGNGAPATPPALAAVAPVPAVRRDLEVPEYLRRSTGRRIGPWLALALLFLIGGAAVIMFGGDDLRQKLGLAAGAQPADQPKQPEIPKAPADQPTPARPIADKVSSPVDSTTATPTTDSTLQPKPTAPVEDATAPQPSPPKPSDNPPRDDDVLPKETAPPKEATPPKENAPPPDPINPPPPDPGISPPVPSKTPLPIGTAIGQYSAPDDVLLREDAKGETWVRLAPGTTLAVGDRLLALPGFRPSIIFNAGVTLQLDGGTIIRLISGDGGHPGVHVEHGRLIRWGASGKTGVACRVLLGEVAADIRFSDPDSAVAVEVYRYFEPGEDPINAPGPIVADIAVLGGQIEWLADGEAQAAVMRPGTGRTWVGKKPSASKPVLRLPGWVDPVELSEIDQRGIAEVKKALEPNKPVGLATRELIEVRRSETRSLAARGVGFLGKYDALLAGLKDESLSWAQWRVKYVGGLRSAILRGPEEATRVRDALIKEFGAKMGADLYRMLCGYNPKQLASGADQGLVDLLSDDELPYRVLAFYNLQAITQVTHGYRPEGTDIQRRTPTQTWSAWQRTGRIVYKDATPTKNGAAKNSPDDAPAIKAE